MEAIEFGEPECNVREALERARADFENKTIGGSTSRQHKDEDARMRSRYVIHQAQIEVEKKLEEQWKTEQAKKREVEAIRLQNAAAASSSALHLDIDAARKLDEKKKDTERAKFQAVAQRVEYDQFEQMVAGASLHAMKTSNTSGKVRSTLAKESRQAFVPALHKYGSRPGFPSC